MYAKSSIVLRAFSIADATQCKYSLADTIRKMSVSHLHVGPIHVGYKTSEQCDLNDCWFESKAHVLQTTPNVVLIWPRTKSFIDDLQLVLLCVGNGKSNLWKRILLSEQPHSNIWLTLTSTCDRFAKRTRLMQLVTPLCASAFHPASFSTFWRVRHEIYWKSREIDFLNSSPTEIFHDNPFRHLPLCYLLLLWLFSSSLLQLSSTSLLSLFSF